MILTALFSCSFSYEIVMFSNGELMFNDVELTFGNVELIFNDAEHNLSVGKDIGGELIFAQVFLDDSKCILHPFLIERVDRNLRRLNLLGMAVTLYLIPDFPVIFYNQYLL